MPMFYMKKRIINNAPWYARNNEIRKDCKVELVRGETAVMKSKMELSQSSYGVIS